MAVSKVILNGETLIDVTQKTVTPSNMLSGITALKNDGTDITGSIAAKSAADLITSGSQVTVPSGMYAAAATTAIASGSLNGLISLPSIKPTWSLNSSTGIINAEYAAAPGIQPIASSGYFKTDEYIYPMVTMDTSYQLPTKAAATITPTTSDQVVASGYFLTGAQIIKGDSALIPSNIAAGVSIFGIEGTHQGGASGSGGSIWQDANGQIHLATDGFIEQLNVTQNGTYTNPSGAYNPVVVNVSGGGDDKPIKFIDYDGTILYKYTLAEFTALDGMPANPSHAGLVAQGWNWDRQEVFDYLEAMPDWPVVVGQMYVTESGKTEIDIELPADALSPWLLLYKNGGSGSLDIDWGDGSTHDVVTDSMYAFLNHNYSNAGKYTIKISAQNTTFSFTQGRSSSGSYVGFFRSDANKNYDLKYASTIKAIRLGNGITVLQHVLKFQNLEYITIPSTVTSIYEIIDCYSLKGLVFPKNITSYSNLRSAIKLKNVSIRPLSSNLVVRDCISLKYYTCSSKATQIIGYTFQGCNNLSLPSTLPLQTQFIGYNTFQSCYQLTSINLPSSVSRLDSYAFSSCVNLSSIDIPSTVSSIGANAFQGCYNLDSIDISAIPTIQPYTFQYCKSLSSISLSSALTSIGTYAFSGCSNLSLVDIPSTVSYIGPDAFYNCISLQSISIPSLITTILSDTFQNCNSLSLIDIPSTISSIGNYAFYCDYSLISINLPSALASIGHYGFASCRSLSSITIPALTTYLGNQAFYDCLSMQECHFLPTTPPTIGTNVFQGIPSTCKIYVPYSSDHSILNAYKTKTNWAVWSSYMEEEPQ